MIKFADLIKIKFSGCTRCFSILYALPCQIDRNIVGYFVSFGKPTYPLKIVNLLRIDADGGYHIEGRLNAKVIKFIMPKEFENSDLRKAARKIEFEEGLAKWMSDKLKIDIVGG
ncbi:hypothetical protein LCGC14_2230510 [marine sediment metagenome]|uniref:Uncharacterized protein n=1 Tax=marine sediment metagenome TaxID=412755 RepID=A0A0F9G3L9_9ZZZZ